MAFTINRRLSQLLDSSGQLLTGKIPDDYVTVDHIANNAITTSMLHTSFLVPSSSLSSIDTDNVGEGSTNVYYTDARVGTYISGNRSYGNITTTGYLAGPATFTIDPAGVGDNTGTVVIAGNLQVDGTTTTINSTTLAVDDLNLTLASGAADSSAANGAGITIDGASATITYDGTNDEWDFNKGIHINSTDSIKLPVGTTAQRNSSPVAGMFRYNSTTGEFEGYTDAWGAIAGGGNGSYTTDKFTATSGQTNFTLSSSVTDEDNLIVFVDGVFQAHNTYSVSGTTLIFSTGIVLNRVVTVYHVTPVSIGVPSDNTVTSAKLSGALTIDGLTVDGDAIISDTTPSLLLMESDTTDVNTRLLNNGGDFFLSTINDVKNSVTNRLSLDHATGDIAFYEDTGSTAKFFWDASAESLGIGTDSPDELLHIYHATANINAIIESGDANAYLAFKDNSTTSNASVFLGASANDMTFFAGGATERMRIDSSGNLLVGKTSTSFSTDGVEIKNDQIWSTNTSSDCISLNRKTTDGAMATFYKDGSTVGSIGVIHGNNLFIGAPSHSGLQFGTSVVYPTGGSTGDANDATVDIGASGQRFKDLYLSGKAKTAGADFSGQVQHFAGNVSTYYNAGNSRYGQIYMDGQGFNIKGFPSSGEPIIYNASSTGASHRFQVAGAEKVRITNDGLTFNGDTAAANALDDYEEGTWSPSLGNSANINSLNLTEAGRYVKVGNLVHVEFDVTGSFVNAAVESRFSFSLPFNTATTSSRATGMFSHLLTSFSNGRFNNGQVFQGTTQNSALFVYVSTNQLSGTGSFNGRATVTYVAS